MNFAEYIHALKSHITAHPPDLDNEDSVLGILYEAMHGIPLREMDKIVYPICTLCRDHQKSGFIEGVRIGVMLCDEFTGDSHASI